MAKVFTNRIFSYKKKIYIKTLSVLMSLIIASSVVFSMLKTTPIVPAERIEVPPDAPSVNTVITDDGNSGLDEDDEDELIDIDIVPPRPPAPPQILSGCGCPECLAGKPCECDYVCINPDHINFKGAPTPTLDADYLSIFVARPATLEALRASCVLGATAYDGQDKTLTSKIAVKTIDGVTPETFWSRHGGSEIPFGPIRVVLSVENGHKKTAELERLVTIADEPAIEFDDSKFNIESYEGFDCITINAGDTFNSDTVRAAVTVSDRYNGLINSPVIIIDWSDFSSVTAGLYKINITAVNPQNIRSRLEKRILVKERENPFKFYGEQNFRIIKPTGAQLKEACLNGITAFDYGTDITSRIFIKRFGGYNATGEFNWDAYTDDFGTAEAVLGVEIKGISFEVKRDVTIVDYPVIEFDRSIHDWTVFDGDDCIVLEKGGTFSLKGAMNVVDRSDPALTAQDIIIDDTNVDSNIRGKYPVYLTVTNNYGVTTTIVVYVYVTLTSPQIIWSGSFNLVVQNGALKQVQECAAGLKAENYDGEALTIKIESVNGISADFLSPREWEALANTPSTLKVLLSVTDPADPLNTDYLTRFITLAELPVINFDNSLYGIEDGPALTVTKGDSFDYKRGLSVKDGTDKDLSAADIVTEIKFGTLIDGYFSGAAVSQIDTGELGVYELTFKVTNKFGFDSYIVTRYLIINPPKPVINGGRNEVIFAKSSDVNAFKEAALSGLTAEDGEGNAIPAGDITINLVNGVKPGEGFDWGGVASTIGLVNLELLVMNSYGELCSFARAVRIVDIPVISFDDSAFLKETVNNKSHILVYLGDGFDYMNYLTVTDGSDPDISGNLAVSGAVNTFAVGTYNIKFDITNKWGIRAAQVEYDVLVRDKHITERNGIEIYNLIQNNLKNSYYTASSRGTFGTGWGAAAKYDGMYTKTVNSPGKWSYEEAYNGYVTSFSIFLYSTFEDFCRANKIEVDKTSGSAVFGRDDMRDDTFYQKGFSSSGDLWPNGKNFNASYKALSDWNNLSDYENYFGRPYMQDSNFYITADTLNYIPKAIPNGDGTYDITYSLKTSRSGIEPGVAGRMRFLSNLQRKSVEYGSANDTYATMTYTVDAGCKVYRKSVQEEYRTDFGGSWYAFNTDFTETYVYDSVQPAASNLRTAQTNKSAGESAVSDHYIDEYCHDCDCCNCCPYFISGDSASKPSPYIGITDPEKTLIIKQGQSAVNFQKALYSGVNAFSSSGQEISLQNVWIESIDGVINNETFNWDAYRNALGSHIVKYGIMDLDDRSAPYSYYEREFIVSSVPEIKFDYSGAFVDVLPTDIKDANGEFINANHIVILLGSSFDRYANITVTDALDGTISPDRIFFEGDVNPLIKGVYSVKVWAVNSYGVSGTKRTLYYIVRDLAPKDVTFGLQAYNLVSQKTAASAFMAESRGKTEAEGAGTLTVYGTRQHSGSETFFQNISHGSAVWGVNVSFARSVYKNGDSYKRRDAEGGFSANNGTVTVNNWGSPYNYSQGQYEEDFGRKIDDLCNYAITADSVRNPNSGYIKNADGTYTIAFEIKLDAGNNSEGIKDYCRQVRTMSGGKSVKTFEYAAVTVIFDEAFRALSVSTRERYVVNTGVSISPTSLTQTDVTDTYSYPANVIITKF